MAASPQNQNNLLQLLKMLIVGERESWTYAIFWRSSANGASAQSVLGWGDGYYEGCEQHSTTNHAQQDHRKQVLRELISLINESPDEAVDEDVTDQEWFFLISMTHSFVAGDRSLPGQALHAGAPSWVAGEDHLAASPCERVQLALSLGMKTMVCVPGELGVVELGSTELIFASSGIMGKIRRLFDFQSLPQSTVVSPGAPELDDQSDSESWGTGA